MIRDICLDIAVPRERASDGWSDVSGRDHYTRAVLVEPDGSVLAWDEIGGIYSRLHDLTDAEVAEAQRLSGQVRSGTHYAGAGSVFECRP